MADPASTIEQLAVGYYCESKNLNVVLDALRAKLYLDSFKNDKWKRATRKLFKKNENDETKGSKANDAGDATVEMDTVGETEVKKSKNKSKKATNQDTEAHEKTKSKSAKTKSNTDGDDVDEMTEAPTIVDDFFITADGSNYLSNAVVNSTQKDDSDAETPFPPKKQSHEFVMNGRTGSGQPGKKFEKSTGPKRFAGEKRQWNDESNDPAGVKEERKIDPNLHPSWVAKQKQKPTIAEFKGTKITFD